MPLRAVRCRGGAFTTLSTAFSNRSQASGAGSKSGSGRGPPGLLGSIARLRRVSHPEHTPRAARTARAASLVRPFQMASGMMRFFAFFDDDGRPEALFFSPSAPHPDPSAVPAGATEIAEHQWHELAGNLRRRRWKDGAMVPHPPPADKKREEMRAYHAALGRFITWFAKVESRLRALLAAHAGVAPDMAKAVFSGVKTVEAQSYINRIFQVAPDAAEQAELKAVFDQLFLINAARNLIIHHDLEIRGANELRVSNRAWALTESHGKEMGVSAELLDAMTSDLQAINWRLLAAELRKQLSPEEAAMVVSGFARTPWRYKSPPQASKADKPRRSAQARSRPRPPSPE